MQHSLNQIVQYFRTLSTDHKQINSFGVGEDFDIEADGALNAGLLWVNPAIPRIDGDNIIVPFQVFCIDLVKKDFSNELEVMSDQLRIAQDVIAYFSSSTFTDENLFIEKSISFEPVKQVSANSWSGYEFEISFKQLFYNDACQIPLVS